PAGSRECGVERAELCRRERERAADERGRLLGRSRDAQPHAHATHSREDVRSRAAGDAAARAVADADECGRVLMPDYPDYDPYNPDPPPPQPPPQNPTPFYGSAQEQQAARDAFRSHVSRQSYLTGKIQEPDYGKAYELYGQNRTQGQNYGDAVNHAITALKWDDPNAWQTSAAPTDPNAGTGGSPHRDLWTRSGSNPQSFVSAYIAQTGLRGAQADPTALNNIVGVLQGLGVNAQLDTRSDGLHKGIMLNGQFVKMLDGRDNWIWDTSGGGGGDPNTAYYESLLKARAAELQQPVNDPSRAALARLLEQQTQMFQQQQEEQRRQNEILKQRQAQAGVSRDTLLKYVGERATKLQGPAYTGSEENILRTQALDPIETDRTNAQKRALERISRSGMDLSSGIAQDLQRQVDSSFDRERSGAQNDLAYKQITEQRSREQEAQQLLAYIPQAQEAAARGDLEFLQMLDRAVQQLGAGGIVSQGQSAQLGESVRNEEQARRQELLGIGGQIYELPTNAAQGAMAALGYSPNPASLTAQTIQLAQLANQRQSQNANLWLSLGQSFAGMFR